MGVWLPLLVFIWGSCFSVSSTSIQVTKLSRFINNAEQLAVPFKAVSDTPPSQCAVVCGKEIACIGMNHHPDMQSCELVDETGFQQRYQPNDVDWRMYMDAPRNPEWGEWSQFSECSQSSGCGTQFRSRTCINTPTAECSGDTTETRTCNCPDEHAFQVIRSKSVTYTGYDFLALEVRVPADGLSRSTNWCYDYRYLCEDFNRRPTGCGATFSSSSNYKECSDTYNSDMNIEDTLSCNPSSHVANLANDAFPNSSQPAQYFKNAFGFHTCQNCDNPLQGSDMALTYMRDFWLLNMTTFYTVCR